MSNSETSNGLESMILFCTVGYVIINAIKNIYEALVLFMMANQTAIQMGVLKLLGGILLIYLLYFLFFRFYHGVWAPLHILRKTLDSISSDLKKDIRNLESEIRDVRNDFYGYRKVPSRIQTLAENIIKIKKFTGLQKIEEDEEAKKKIIKAKEVQNETY